MSRRGIFVYVRGIITLAVAYFVFWRWARFTEVQALLLAFLAAEVIGLATAAVKTSEPFEPFHLWIQPRWFDLLRDQGLMDEEKWKAIGAALPGKEVYNALRDNISLTVLGPSLYFDNDHKHFFFDLHFTIPLPEVQPPEERGKFLSYPPSLYVRTAWQSGIEYIQIGLRTQDSSKNAKYPGDSRGDVPLANFPYALLDSQRAAALPKKIDRERLLRDGGWTQREHDEVDRWARSPEEFNHRYVTILFSLT